MKVGGRLQQLLIKTISESMTVEIMLNLVRRCITGYNIYERTGFPPNIPIPKIDAATRIIKDLVQEGIAIQFIELLIDVYENGLMGRSININLLPQLIKELKNNGLIYDGQRHTFIEAPQKELTKGWSVLQEGQTYDFAFLRIDIVDNSELVRRYTKEEIGTTYNDLHTIFKNQVERRDGRIWEWEGDGGIAAFYLRGKNISAVLSGIEILLELYLYNLFRCRLKEPLQARLAVHTGPSQFFSQKGNGETQSHTLRKLQIMESEYTAPNYLTLSQGVYSDLGTKLEQCFQPLDKGDGHQYYTYGLIWEE
jgi:hypothetical protein